ncbi:MAG: hypothetical protein AAGC67_06360 [Myxococcota bacterium]
MKGAIASVDVFAAEADAPAGERRRLTLTVTAPERSEAADGWVCRVALADLHRPIAVEGRDSVTALAGALDRARSWLAELSAQGTTLFRDRTGESRFELG